MKQCCICKTSKELSEFGVLKNSRDGRRGQCRSCRSLYDKKRLKEDPKLLEKKRDRDRRYYESNKERLKKYQQSQYVLRKQEVREYNQKYYLQHKEDIVGQVKRRSQLFPEIPRRYQKNRKQNDLNFRLRLNLRNRLLRALKGRYKHGSAVTDLGCSINELVIHLERQFIEGMCWGNYGKGDDQWSIDHIMPLSRFDLSDRQHFLLAAHYLNLRPMWHIDNVIKGNRTEGVA